MLVCVVFVCNVYAFLGVWTNFVPKTIFPQYEAVFNLCCFNITYLTLSSYQYHSSGLGTHTHSNKLEHTHTHHRCTITYNIMSATIFSFYRGYFCLQTDLFWYTNVVYTTIIFHWIGYTSFITFLSIPSQLFRMWATTIRLNENRDENSESIQKPRSPFNLIRAPYTLMHFWIFFLCLQIMIHEDSCRS